MLNHPACGAILLALSVGFLLLYFPGFMRGQPMATLTAIIEISKIISIMTSQKILFFYVDRQRRGLLSIVHPVQNSEALLKRVLGQSCELSLSEYYQR
jgi:hypothetical protein